MATKPVPDDNPDLRQCRMCHRSQRSGGNVVIPCGEDGIPICSKCAYAHPDFTTAWVMAAEVLGAAERVIANAIKFLKSGGTIE